MLNRRHLTLAAVILMAATAAHAQSPLGIGTAEPGIAPTGLGGSFFAMINAWQQQFYRALTTALKAMREDPHQLWILIGLSFAYGVFHAAGPGHGKAVISSYMIANETELKRGVLISFVSAFLQGGTAILLVGAAWLVLRGSAVSMTQATHALEVASFALIVLFGATLLFRKLKALRPAGALSAGPALVVPGGDGQSRFESVEVTRHHGHQHGPGEVCASCGHAHAPDPALLQSERFGIADAWSAVIAVGLRPCSGALLVLTFSLLNGLYLGGILSVVAMSIGTAITVSALAIMAVTAKGAAVRFAGIGSRRAAIVGHAFEIGGALMVMVLGLILLIAALQA